MMHGEFGHWGNWLCGPGFFFTGPLGLIINLLFWGIIIYLLVKLFQTLFSRNKGTSGSNLDLVKERYARGEINEEEYKRMMAELA
jgi:putative membrane protein